MRFLSVEICRKTEKWSMENGTVRDKSTNSIGVQSSYLWYSGHRRLSIGTSWKTRDMVYVTHYHRPCPEIELFPRGFFNCLHSTRHRTVPHRFNESTINPLCPLSLFYLLSSRSGKYFWSLPITKSPNKTSVYLLALYLLSPVVRDLSGELTDCEFSLLWCRARMFS